MTAQPGPSATTATPVTDRRPAIAAVADIANTTNADPSINATSSAPPTAMEAMTSPRTIALMNQKGGVGKTTTTVNLAAGLAAAGRRVLLIDMDPQAHLTLHLGLEDEKIGAGVYELLTDASVTAEQVLHKISDRLSVLPAEVNLAGVEAELAPRMITGSAQRVLKEKCRPLLTGPRAARAVVGSGADEVRAPGDESGDGASEGFDYVLIDCPPSLGLLTVNALTLAGEVIVPMQAQFLALQGLSKLLETVSFIQQSFNSALRVSGIVLCMHERQTILASEVLNDLHTFLASVRDQDVPWRDARILQPPIRRNIKLAECPSFGKTIFDYAPQSHGAEDYRRLAESVDARAG